MRSTLCCQQAIGQCGLAQERLIQETPANQLDTTSSQIQNHVTLVYNKLLSARCVQQQIETIQQQQVQVEEADAAAGQQHSKQSTLSGETAPVHTNRHAGSGVTNACSNFQEPAPDCCADALKPVMASLTDEQTADAATAAVACIRYGLTGLCIVCIRGILQFSLFTSA